MIDDEWGAGDGGGIDSGDISVDVSTDAIGAGDYDADFESDAGEDLSADAFDAGEIDGDLAEDIGEDLGAGAEAEIGADTDSFDAETEGEDLSAEADDEAQEPPDGEDYSDAESKYENDPLNEDGSLKPNIEYMTGEYDYRYATDDGGRISRFETDELQLTERDERLTHDGNTLEKGEFDDAGHLFGDRFGGSPELDNLVSQDAHINRGEYKAMENEWADAIQNGSQVEVAGDVIYDSDSKRPSSFDVFYAIDGEVYEKSFTNGRE